jgi:hypothetical protein
MKKYNLLDIAWIIIGTVILVHYSFIICRTWSAAPGDFHSSLRPYLLYIIISIFTISGGIGGLFHKMWAKIILILISLLLLFITGGLFLSYLTGLLRYYQNYHTINGYFDQLSLSFEQRIIQFAIYPIVLVISLLTIIQFWGGIKQFFRRINKELWG